jgi:hypothetical protein
MSPAMPLLISAFVFRPSHFTAVLLCALFASTIFGITQRHSPRAMLRYGAWCFLLFSGSVIVASWLMALILH